MEEKKAKNKRKFVIPILLAIVLFIVGVIFYPKVFSNQEEKAEIITTATLEKIINTSELNTFQAVYNGIAKVMNEEETAEIDLYASYEAKVYAGFDFEKIIIEKDSELKTINVTIPLIEITDVNVDIASLDFMYQNDDADASMVSERAYKACIKDVTDESKVETEIYKLAKQNAINIVEALISPFIEQFDPEYKLVIE